MKLSKNKAVQSNKTIESTTDSDQSKPILKVSKGPDGNETNIVGTEKEIAEMFSKTLGTSDMDFAKLLIKQVHNAHPDKNKGNTVEIVNQVTPMLYAIEPRDELEGMLAAQMVGIHNLTMEMMGRASIPDQTVEGVNDNINRITKLSRTFVAQLEALDRHRNKGQQKMTVEHVHVNEGGQAVIGNISKGGDDERK